MSDAAPLLGESIDFVLGELTAFAACTSGCTFAADFIWLGLHPGITGVAESAIEFARSLSTGIANCGTGAKSAVKGSNAVAIIAVIHTQRAGRRAAFNARSANHAATKNSVLISSVNNIHAAIICLSSDCPAEHQVRRVDAECPTVLIFCRSLNA